MIEPKYYPFVGITVLVAIAGLMYFMGVFSSKDKRTNTGATQRQNIIANRSMLTNQANRKNHFENAAFKNSGIGRPTLFTNRARRASQTPAGTFQRRGPANFSSRTEFNKIGASSKFDKPFSMNNPRPVMKAYASKR